MTCTHASKVERLQSILAFMQDHDMRWDDVQLFLALCRARSIGDAARALDVDGSTVSRRLTGLEESIGATLFERSRAGVSATEAAEALLPIAEEIEHAMARFVGQVEAFEREVEGLVRITCPPDAAEALIAPLLPDLLETHPRLRIELDASASLLDVSRRATDIALRIVKPERGDLIVTRLLEVEWVVAATAELAEELGTVRRWSDLDWIGFADRFSDAPPARWLARHVDVPPLLSSESLRVQIGLVGTGLGVALVPSLSVTHYELEPVTLSRALRRDVAELPKTDLYMVSHRALRHVPRVRAVWSFIREHAPQL